MTSKTANAVDIKEQLEHGTLDLGVMMEPVDTSSFDYIRMKGVDYWGLLMAADCPLAQKEYITEKDLKDLPIIVSNRQILRGELQHWLKGRLNIRATYNIITNVANVVREGYLKALTIDGGGIPCMIPKRWCSAGWNRSFRLLLCWPGSGSPRSFMR